LSGRDDRESSETTMIEGPGGGPEGPATRLARGTTVGRYVVIDVVGSGGMGVVYSAFDPELDRKVALKLLRPEARANVGSMRARDRLLREAQAMAKLSHPNVLPVFDVGTYESAVFVALEFIEGDTLRAWLDRQKPAWRDIVDVLGKAGRGLAAAHAEGLVHRDFKPENVLLGRRGDVRVMDFGLARPAADSESAEATRTDGRAPIIDGDHLTKTGFVLGTPAYMAPEQHRDAPIDARADQFAYCVTLYEAVYGERPFAGRIASEVMAAAMARAVRPPPQGSKVPRWLRRVILRGLAPDPAERWPDMATLVAELDRDRRAPVMLAAVVTATTALAVAGGFVFGRNTDDTSPCEVHRTDLDEVWSVQRRADIGTQFATSAAPYAAETWLRAATGIDAWTTQWIAARVEACDATRVRSEQNESTMERRGLCLDRRRAQLEGLLGVFAVADAAVVERAIASVAALDPVASCSHAHELGGGVAPPSPEIAAEVERVRGELARLRPLQSTARLGEALAMAVTARDTAIALGYAPLVAEARVDHGIATADLGELEPGIAEITAAIDLAEENGQDALVARAEIALVGYVAELGKSTEAERWAVAATAKLRRIGGDERLEARLLTQRSGVADESGKYDAARQHAQAAVELWSRLETPGPERAMALGNLGRVAYRAQDFAGAREHFEQAREAAEKVYGPKHPEIAKLWSNIAAALHAQGEMDASGEALERSLAVFEAALPPDHPDIATTLTNLSAFKYRVGRYDEAIAISQRVIEMRRRMLGARSPKIAGSLNNQAIALLALGRLDEALARYQEALALIDGAFPDGHPEAAGLLTGIGDVLVRKQDFDAAVPVLERALAIGSGEGVNPYANAEAKFVLVQALWDADRLRDRARARQLALESAETLRSAPAYEQKHLQRIDTWLREHSP
jgi:tetratricopeptide (TPR) repeat protein/predicted Ser/Thr protein kinase